MQETIVKREVHTASSGESLSRLDTLNRTAAYLPISAAHADVPSWTIRSNATYSSRLKGKATALSDDADDTWTEAKNQRRCDLIDRKYAGGLTASQALELAWLQEQMLRHRQRVAPLPIEDAERLYQELVTRGKVS
jgi:hypothetical protein